MYNYEITHHLQKIMQKLSKKDKIIYERLIRKIEEIINAFSVEHYKNLKSPLQHLKRVHVGEKVLIFRFNKEDR